MFSFSFFLPHWCFFLNFVHNLILKIQCRVFGIPMIMSFLLFSKEIKIFNQFFDFIFGQVGMLKNWPTLIANYILGAYNIFVHWLAKISKTWSNSRHFLRVAWTCVPPINQKKNLYFLPYCIPNILKRNLSKLWFGGRGLTNLENSFFLGVKLFYENYEKKKKLSWHFWL